MQAIKTVWRVVAASQQGAGHVRSDVPCQDAAGYRIFHCNGTARPLLVAAVCDGAGSASRSEAGARTAVHAALFKIGQLLATHRKRSACDVLPGVLLQSVCAVHEELALLSQRENIELREYATTLLLAVLWDDVLGTAQVGDGAVVAGSGDGEYFLATEPERGEYANATRFVTSLVNAETPQIGLHDAPDCNRLAMFTDGIQNLVLDYKDGPPKVFPPFFDRVFEWFEAQPNDLLAYSGMRQFLGSSSVQQRTDDDVTLFLAMRQ